MNAFRSVLLHIELHDDNDDNHYVLDSVLRLFHDITFNPHSKSRAVVLSSGQSLLPIIWDTK